jgi:hypothetical protein
MCGGVGVSIPVTVELKEPLGDRLVLDGTCDPPVEVAEPGETRNLCDPSDQQLAEEGDIGTWAAFDPGPLKTRSEPKAVWTGTEMLVFGGGDVYSSTPMVDGAAFNPSTNKWRSIASSPVPGRILAAMWTGSVVITVGQSSGALLTDARAAQLYDPKTDTWRVAASPPHGFAYPLAWWTGQETIVWSNGSGSLYDPRTDTWREIPAPDLPDARPNMHALWLEGASLLAVQEGVQGAEHSAQLLFDPAANTWRRSAAAPKDHPRFNFGWPTFVGGLEIFNFDTPADTKLLAYDPARDDWRYVPTTGADQNAGGGIFDGRQLADGRGLVRSGDAHRPLLLFDPTTKKWSHAAAPRKPIPADGAFVWTGTEALLWGRPAEASETAPNAAWRWKP